jgi:glycosyltransferase involved in cell wall biosynthesis
MSNKTLLITINTSWNVYNFRLNLLKALQKQGYKIVVVAPKDEYSQKLIDMGFEYHDIDINNKGTNPIEDTKLIYDYYQLLKQIRPDVVLGYTIKPNIYASIACRLLHIPIINNISGLGTVFLDDSLSSKVARWMYKIALSKSKKVFFQNSADRELFIANKLVKENIADLVPGSGIDTNRFAPQDIEINSTKTRFLMIARLVRDKGIMEYIEAAHILKQKYDNVEFALLGSFYFDNPTALTKEELQVWQDKGVVNYLGVSDDVASIIAQYDCIVLPSYREGLSRVLLEAASMAKPIVTTNVPGCKDVVKDGYNGFLAKLKDAKDLALQMQKIIDLDSESKIQMGKNSREKIINEFSEDKVIDKYVDAISNIC